MPNRTKRSNNLLQYQIKATSSYPNYSARVMMEEQFAPLCYNAISVACKPKFARPFTRSECPLALKHKRTIESVDLFLELLSSPEESNIRPSVKKFLKHPQAPNSSYPWSYCPPLYAANPAVFAARKRPQTSQNQRCLTTQVPNLLRAASPNKTRDAMPLAILVTSIIP